MTALRSRAAGARLPGNRLHLQEGPIDLVIGAEGASDEVGSAYAQASAAFDGLLAALVRELPLLRTPVSLCGVEDPAGDSGATAYLARFHHPVARAMAEACLPHAALWVTPMAAVAGAVADHLLAAMTRGRTLAKAWVNDGGDVAFHLAPGAVFELGLVTDLADGAPGGLTRIAAGSRVRGAATSGRQGRSLSRGIAEAVTVLAPSAAAADVAATLIANAVDLEEHLAIVRRPACELAPDSDLGDIPVVTAVGPLTPAEIEAALAGGARLAEQLHRAGLIEAALLGLRRRHRAIPAPKECEEGSKSDAPAGRRDRLTSG